MSMENASGVVYDALGINGAHAERLLSLPAPTNPAWTEAADVLRGLLERHR